jgi:hypothetical protein
VTANFKAAHWAIGSVSAKIEQLLSVLHSVHRNEAELHKGKGGRVTELIQDSLPSVGR